MPSVDEAEINDLLLELIDAWNRGDVDAYGVRYRNDATFTNVNGMFHVGCEEFYRWHSEIIRGALNGSTISLIPRRIWFIRPDVAAVEVDCGVLGARVNPLGVQADSGGSMHTSLLLVPVKEKRAWWITAYHNVWQATVRYESTVET